MSLRRRATRTASALVVLGILAPLPACGRSGASAPAPAPSPAPLGPGTGAGAPGGGDFRALYRGYSSDYEPARSLAELAGSSTVVAIGRLTDVRAGRLPSGSLDREADEFLVHRFAVERVLKGQADGPALAVETPKTQLRPAADFARAIPAGTRAVLYLQPVPPSDPGEMSDERAGLEPGETLVRPTTPQGFLLFVDGVVFHPLSPVPSENLFDGDHPDPGDLRSWLPADLRAAV